MKVSIIKNGHTKSTAGYGATLAGAMLWGLAVQACVAPPEPLALEHEVYEVQGGAETLVDSGCTELPTETGAGFGFGFGAAPGPSPSGYSVSYTFENDSVLVSAGAFGGNSTEREYDELFLSTEREDELVVEIAPDFALRLVNRGVSGCGVSGGGASL